MHHHLPQLEAGLEAVAAWQARWAEVPAHESLIVSEGAFGGILAGLAARLTDNYPFHHPVYAGQMLKPPHPIAQIAYAMAMQINPNNHALDGGPATAALEREAVSMLATMFGFETHLGHLTSSGTIANLEALWVARQIHPGLPIAFSRQAHYTHARMAEVLGIETVVIDVDDRGRMDVADLQVKYAETPFGTVVVTLGTTGLGALDPLDAIADWAGPRGVRIHVDAAYGGFYALLAQLDPPMVNADPYMATSRADSLVIDPHKHGLQPYGCGCVLFRDPAVGQLYRHDSPYTYFTSKALHLGEISLECSRAGAAAAAFWATLQAFPLLPERGLGLVLQACRMAALDWAERLEASQHLHLIMQPELDILTFFPSGAGWQASAISAESDAIFHALMNDPSEPVYLAKIILPRALVAPRAPRIVWDTDTITVLRSCLLKPEHEQLIPYLHKRVERAAAGPSGWDEVADAPPPPRRAMTGPLSLKGEWETVMAAYFEKAKPALVAELRELVALPFHGDVALLDFEASYPYGIGSELGVRMYTLGSDGWMVHPGEGDAFSGSRVLLASFGPVIPNDAMDPARFASLIEAMEDTYELAGSYMLAWFRRCWVEAGGLECPLPAYIGFSEDDECLDLRADTWIEDGAREMSKV